MSKPIESYFDDGNIAFSFWNRPNGSFTISNADIIFQAPLFKLSYKSKTWKERYFVLTSEYFFYLKSEGEPKIIALMKVPWTRVDYLIEKSPGSQSDHYCFRFLRNMKYTDLFTEDEVHFQLWRSHMSKVFLQCDFHTKYNTIKMIGKGSFARVYLVENTETKARHAVKAFSKEYLLSQPKGKEAIMNEIEMMQKLKHPFIMSLEEVHESKNSIYLVLELLEGGELMSNISSKERPTLRDYSRVMKCTLEALAYMADRNIMHRDIKPENMILKEKNKLEFCTVKLVDFGLATAVDIPEYLFKRCGTPGFVAPEVINAASNSNTHYTSKCDVFSAGVIFYILLTEKSPFDGKSLKDILHKNKKCIIDFKHPNLKSNKIALDLLIKMLHPDPDQRLSARGALDHKFFTNFTEKNMIIEYEGSTLHHNSSPLNEKYQIFKANVHNYETNSLIVRDPVITGNTRTIKESANSIGGISSFKSMNKPTKGFPIVKRESILKFVLLQNSNQNSGNIYESKFAGEEFNSDSEDCENMS
jgi:serine/threonine protein kinase